MDSKHLVTTLTVDRNTQNSTTVVFRQIVALASAQERMTHSRAFSDKVTKYLVLAKLRTKSITAEKISKAADDPYDALIGDTAVHVTNHPSEQLILKCTNNLAQNLRPLIVTNQKGVAVASDLAEAAGIEERIDVLEIGQFMATNVYEKSQFIQKMRSTTLGEIVAVYNRIIEECETDPSLRIEMD